MATSTQASSPDTLIQIKVIITGKDETRRFKLPLKELGANSLPDKLRNLLSIGANQFVLFERYSDSSSSYITLDSNNISVYKQLYRAAKAKSKLKIRVTVNDKPASKAVEMPKSTITLPERLTARAYVHPYISEPGKDEKDTEVTSIYPEPPYSNASATTLVPPGKSSSDTLREAAQEPIPKAPTLYSWPVSQDGGYSETTKVAFEKKEGLWKAPTSRENFVDKDLHGEAPVPRFFSDRESFLARQASFSKKLDMIRNPVKSYASGRNHSIPGTSFTICCNHCDKSSPEAHWHCSTCDHGDFDLCGECVENGHHCDDDDHFLVKRFVKDGKVISSTTETIAPRKNAKIEDKVPGAFVPYEIKREEVCGLSELSRTCNSCVQVFDESKFVTCVDCEDYDLCIPCHVGMKHGHHPSHTFAPASQDVKLDTLATTLCAPGRNILHLALCDVCDKDIYGIRHKCIDCPDWDCCSTCINSVKDSHPGHRFIPLYERIPTMPKTRCYQRHSGILCDGPLCVGKKSYITGIRYKCAVCHDTDFCASCEALPKSGHNRTHPLIKFKTAVNNVSVTTMGETQNGEQTRIMGDHPPQTSSKSTETTPAAPSANAATQVQTVAEVKPTEAAKEEAKAKSAKASSPELHATFIRDTMTDGSSVPANKQFKQTWTLRNPGPSVWPKGCAVCFIGGDAMLDIDSNHPSHISQMWKATQSNVLERVVEVSEEVDFTVTMKTPEREGKAISYWRLKNAAGMPFGHKLWCDVNVVAVKVEEQAQTEHIEDISERAKVEDEVKEEEAEVSESKMIFPKLDKESSIASTHEAETPAPVTPAPIPAQEKELLEDVESLELDSDSDEAFLTDEEYELIATDDEMESAKNGKK